MWRGLCGIGGREGFGRCRGGAGGVLVAAPGVNVVQLPIGTVTSLFTDLEGSTRLWAEHPEAMRAALARHDEILRETVAAHGGRMVKATGDGLGGGMRSERRRRRSARSAQSREGGPGRCERRMRVPHRRRKSYVRVTPDQVTGADMMVTIDQRTRYLGDTVDLDAAWLHDELPAILDDTGVLAARGVEVLGLSTLGFDVDGTTAHLCVADGRLVVREGVAGEGPVAVLGASSFSDLFQDVRVDVRAGDGGPGRDASWNER